jgi:hypothetical protein
MKRFIFLAALIILASSILTAEAALVPEGSTIFIPGEDPYKVSETSFLLDRSDMEEAVLALETVEIQKEAIEKLQKGWQAQKDLTIIAAIGTGILSLILGALVGFVLR